MYVKIHNPNDNTFYQVEMSGDALARMVNGGWHTSTEPFEGIEIRSENHEKEGGAWVPIVLPPLDDEAWAALQRDGAEHKSLELFEGA